MRTRWDALIAGDYDIPANETLGLEIRAAGGVGGDPKESVAFEWTVPAEYCNSAGNLQGGMLAALADSLLGAASAAHLPDDRYPALAEMKISILRPAPAGSTLTGTGRVIKAGRRVLFVEAEIAGPDGKLVAKASGTEIPAEV